MTVNRNALFERLVGGFPEQRAAALRASLARLDLWGSGPCPSALLKDVETAAHTRRLAWVIAGGWVVLEPAGLTLVGGRWAVTGTEFTSGEQRVLPVHRITGGSLRRAPFRPRPPRRS